MTTQTKRPTYAQVRTTSTEHAAGIEGRHRMVFNDSFGCAHHWALNKQTEGKAGNVFFRNGTIYSYRSHFPMARHVRLKDGRVVIFFTTRTYSSSTSRHLGEVRQSIPQGVEVYRIHNVEANYRWQHLENLKAAEVEMEKLLDKAIRARTNRSGLLAEAGQIAARTNEYAEAVGLKERVALPNGVSPEEWIARVKESRTKAQKLNDLKARKRLREECREWEEKLREWRAGAKDRLPAYPDPRGELYKLTYLRVKGSRVQSSLDMAVEVKDVLPILEAVRAGRDLPDGFKVAEHWGAEIDRAEKIVKIGCHRITFEEIERIAKLLKK